MSTYARRGSGIDDSWHPSLNDFSNLLVMSSMYFRTILAPFTRWIPSSSGSSSKARLIASPIYLLKAKYTSRPSLCASIS